MRMRSPGKEAGIPVALSLCSLRNRMDNPLLAVRDITHKYIAVERKSIMSIKNIGWSIGNYCNAKCKHCYSWKMRAGAKDILSKKEIDLIIDKLINYNIETINFGGNEPIFTNGSDVSKTMLPYIIEKFYNANIKAGVTTNGYTAQHLYHNYFKQFLMVNDWDFSLDSPYKEKHNANRKSQDAYDNVLQGLKLCMDYNRPKSIVVAGMKNNLDKDSLKGFLKIAREYDAEIRINFLKPTQKEHMDMFPDAQLVYETVDYLMKYLIPITVSEPTVAAYGNVGSSGCPCGTYSFRIKNKKNGRVGITPCVYMDLDAGDILTESIEEIVESKVFKDFTARENSIPRECKEMGCDFAESCRGGCTARTLLVTGDKEKVDPYCIKTLKFSKAVRNTKMSIEKDSQIRVHDNYLCTFIGKIKENVEI